MILISARLVKNAFFYNLLQRALYKKRNFIILYSAVLVNNGFFYNFVQRASKKKHIFMILCMHF